MPGYRQFFDENGEDFSPSAVPGGPPYMYSRAPQPQPDGSEPGPRPGPAEYTLYKRRWLVIAILAFVNISSALTWITFAPVANFAADYLNTTDAKVNWLSTVYMVTTIPFGFVAVWISDTAGLAPVIILGAFCNTLGLVIRYLAVLPVLTPYRYIVVLVGQGIASLAQPCFLFTPTKVAATWFPEGQRTLANTVGSTSNPLGILIGMLLSSMLVSHPGDIEFLLLLYMIPGIVSGVLAVMVMCYCKNAPPSPPSGSAASHHETFFAGLSKIVRIKAFWVLFLVFGAGLAIFNSITTIMEEVFCPRGYSDSFSGLCGAVMIGSGILGAFLSGVYVDKTKKFALVAKVCFALSAISAIGLAVISRYSGLQVPILVVCACVGFFGFAQFPVSLELGVEATYPVAEGTSAGFLIMSGQIQGILMMQAAQWLAKPMSDNEVFKSCSVSPNVLPVTTVTMETFYEEGGAENLGTVQSQDMTVTMLFYGGYTAVAACIYILCFHTKYKRMRAEHCNAADHILNFSRQNFSNNRNVIY